jgi:hypothetical protein
MILKKTKNKLLLEGNKTKINIQDGSGRVKDWFKRLFRRNPGKKVKLEPLAHSVQPVQHLGLESPRSYKLDMGLGTHQYRRRSTTPVSRYKKSNKNGHRIFVRAESDELEERSRRLSQPPRKSIKNLPSHRMIQQNDDFGLEREENTFRNNGSTVPIESRKLTQTPKSILRKKSKQNKKSDPKITFNTNTDNAPHSIENEPPQIYPSKSVMARLRRAGQSIKNTITRKINNLKPKKTIKNNANSDIRIGFGSVNNFLSKLNETSYRNLIESFYNYYIEFNLLKNENDEMKLFDLIFNKINENENFSIFIENINRFKYGNILYQIILYKLEMIDVLIKKKLIIALVDQSLLTENTFVGGDGSKKVILNDKDFTFIDYKTNELLDYIHNHLPFEGHDFLPVIQEEHNNIYHIMIEYYTCIIKAGNDINKKNQCKTTKSFSDDYIQAYINKIKNYITEPAKAMKEYEEYQPRERTQEEEIDKITGYEEILGEPQFPSSTNLQNVPNGIPVSL